MATEKRQHTVRLSPVGHELLSVLTNRLGIGIAGVMELALRRLADIEGIVIPTTASACIDDQSKDQ